MKETDHLFKISSEVGSVAKKDGGNSLLSPDQRAPFAKAPRSGQCYMHEWAIGAAPEQSYQRQHFVPEKKCVMWATPIQS